MPDPIHGRADALRIANDVRYGLSSYVWTGNLGAPTAWPRASKPECASSIARNVRDLRQPFGGIKASGTGARAGRGASRCSPSRRTSASHQRPSHPPVGRLKWASSRWPPRSLTFRRSTSRSCRASTRAAGRRRSTALRARPALQGARRGHGRGVRRPLARQRRLPRELRAEVQGRLHLERAAALHQEHAVRVRRQPAARPSHRGNRDRDGCPHPRARCHHARPRVRHAGADALHAHGRGKPLHGGVRRGLVQLAQARDSARFGLAVRRAIEERYDGTVAILASGSLSHRFNDNGSPRNRSTRSATSSTARSTCACRAMAEGRLEDFVKMLPTYNATCHGEGHMHDTAMLLGRSAGRLRPAGGDRHALLRQLRDGTDQRGLPGHVASALTRCRISRSSIRRTCVRRGTSRACCRSSRSACASNAPKASRCTRPAASACAPTKPSTPASRTVRRTPRSCTQR